MERKFFILACTFASLLGCGGNDGAPDLSMDLSVDLTMPAAGPDLSYFHQVDANGLACGAQTCSPGQTCCVTGSSGAYSFTCETGCVDGGLPITCQGPGNCGGNPCCITLDNSALTSISCTSAASQCAPALSGSGSGMTRSCNYDGDCTYGLSGNPPYPDCCHLTSNNQRFCFNKGLVGFTGGSIACP
jgi:hypothetical protein